MSALIDWDEAPDEELARAAASGDRAAFAAIYDRYADRLNDFVVRMVRDSDAAADCVHEAFCTAATGLSKLRQPEKLRPWLYAVSRSQALRHIQRRKLEQPADDEYLDSASVDAGPDALAEQDDLARLIREACGGLSDRDREVIELSYRHGLDGPELGKALGVSPATANTLTHRAREMVGRSLGALLVARQTRQDPARCPDLAAVLEGWDGTMTVLMRKRIARHIESCPECESERRRRVSPAALLGAMPFIPAPKELRDTTLADIQLVCWTTDLVDGTGTAPADVGAGTAPAEARRRRPVLPISLAACALVLLVAGLVWTLAGPGRHGREPVDSGITAPLETPATTPLSAPPSTPPPSSAPETLAPVSTKSVAPPVLAPSQQPQPQQDSPAAEPTSAPPPAPPDHPVSRPGPVTRPPMSVAPPSFEAPPPPTGDPGSGGRR
ncbi:sigma-70 family RNA polymerase sigma factor [Mycolicibacterium sp. lyk4-40-TYG-92]|uniref:RNA polymerase sigma factor n=1 Tax=Mycolicibacterium sp. lyk4-40-TYG-92 TaxID=3040295 RepID=UPI002549C7C5|nr:sigma-70 family RNA polymerase sigma factor [Mycolicibacterium sp. lyk4-40-TYG-92]